MQCDIVIPAYNSPSALPLALAALKAQLVPPSWRVKIVMPAGGLNPTPASARNQALGKSDGDIILFLGADIILRPGALAQHLEFHQINPNPKLGALGMVKWDPRLAGTPFMEWMVHGGPQNDFDSVIGQSHADPAHFFYGSHLSLKRSEIGDLKFESFGVYGWEDLGLGRRLAQQGFTLTPLPDAVGLHHHFYPLSRIRQRQRAVGESILRYQKVHSTAAILPRRSRLRQLVRAIFISAGGQAALHALLLFTSPRLSTPRLFQLYTANEFWRGVWKSRFSP